MTPQELKNSILLQAAQGKITDQLLSDGDAKDLLPFLHIDKSLHVGEVPFDIPDNWLWIPIGCLGETTDTDSFCDGPFGSNLKTEHYISSPEVRIIQLSNIGESGWKDKNEKYTSYKHLEQVIPRCEVFPGNLVIAKMMPAGRTIEVPNLGTRITLGSDAMKFVPNKIINKQYLLYIMASQAFLGQVYAEAHGITRVRTTLKGIKSYVLPIPPRPEQDRIVAKIEELLPLIDRYEKAWSRLEEFNKQFPGDMQKSILQMAIQGKLVEQRAEEGTGEELYQQIQAEKQHLIKEGKIKKEKPLPEISDEEKPFDIPETWKWVRLSQLGITQTGNTPSKAHPEYMGHDIPFITPGDILHNQVNYNNQALSLIGKTVARTETSGTIIQVCIGGSIGKAAIVDREISFNQQINSIHPIYCDSNYLLSVMTSQFFVSNMKDIAGGTATPILNRGLWNSLMIPLPPLAEQKRIAQKLDELLPICSLLQN